MTKRTVAAAKAQNNEEPDVAHAMLHEGLRVLCPRGNMLTGFYRFPEKLERVYRNIGVIEAERFYRGARRDAARSLNLTVARGLVFETLGPNGAGNPRLIPRSPASRALATLAARVQRLAGSGTARTTRRRA